MNCLFGGTGANSCLFVVSIVIETLTDSHIFPSYSSALRPLAKDSALAKIKEKRARTRAGMGGAVGISVPATGR
jgi:hypothetical protein